MEGESDESKGIHQEKRVGAGRRGGGVAYQDPPIFRTQAYAAAHNFDVSITDAMVEMADGTPVYHWMFQFTNPTGLETTFPGPVIVANAGDSITLNLTNTLDEAHAFAVIAAGANPNSFVPNSSSGSIAANGGTKTVTFTAPAPGTYLYVDPLNAPVNRVMGLHGVLIVKPASGNNPYGAAATANVAALFNDLGTAPRFPGDPWAPSGDNNRERLWLFASADASFNALVAPPGAPPLDPVTFLQNFIPDYFTINGISGAFASHPPHMGDGGFEEQYRNRDVIVPAGFIGEPILIRILNAAVHSYSAHIHGNHVYVTSVNGVVQSNVIYVDTFSITSPESQFQVSVPPPGSAQVPPILTGGSRVDWLLPIIRPPDVPGEGLLNVVAAQELALGPSDGLITPASPMEFPMHCHTEMSQTMKGGNYPMGLVTHWEILGDRDPVTKAKIPFPGV